MESPPRAQRTHPGSGDLLYRRTYTAVKTRTWHYPSITFGDILARVSMTGTTGHGLALEWPTRRARARPATTTARSNGYAFVNSPPTTSPVSTGVGGAEFTRFDLAQCPDLDLAAADAGL